MKKLGQVSEVTCPRFLTRRGLSLESEGAQEQSVCYLLIGEMRQTPMDHLENKLPVTNLPGRGQQRRKL